MFWWQPWQDLLLRNSLHSRLIAPFPALANPVMTAEPYASAAGCPGSRDDDSSHTVRIKIMANSMATTPEREPGSDDH